MTPRERETLDFIRTYIGVNRFSPSYEEIARHLKLKSKANAHRIVKSLEEQGYVKRDRMVKEARWRCITLVEGKSDTPEPWVKVHTAAERLLASIKREYVNDAGEGVVLVDAAALGDLDVALSEAKSDTGERAASNG